MKTCAYCYENKKIEDFKTYKHKVNNKIYTSLDSYCKKCRKVYDKEMHRIYRAKKKDMEGEIIEL